MLLHILTEHWCLSAPLELCQSDIYIQPIDTRQSSFVNTLTVKLLETNYCLDPLLLIHTGNTLVVFYGVKLCNLLLLNLCRKICTVFALFFCDIFSATSKTMLHYVPAL